MKPGSHITNALALIALVGIVVLAIVSEPPAHTTHLVVDPATVAYRFEVPPADTDDLAVLEQRARSASPQDLTELASLYARRGDYAKAEQLAKQSLALLAEPNNATLVLAKIASARHEFREAIELAKPLARRSNDAQILLATASLAIGDLAAAAEAAEAAATQRPSTSSYLMRALVMEAQGRDAEARYDFARAIAVEAYGDATESARARVLWGRFLLRRGDVASASVLFDAALKIRKPFPLATAYKGEAALRTGHPKQARALFEQAFVDGRELRYLMDQVRATAIAGDDAEPLRTQAERLIRNELAQHGVGHRLDLVEVLVDRGRPVDLDEAIALATEEVARRPSADVRFQLARAQAAAGHLVDAQREIRAALALGTRDARLYELAARVETASGNAQRGAFYAKEALQLDPNGGTWRTYGITLGTSR
jgi:Tfp pilus assembly protein PilF